MAADNIQWSNIVGDMTLDAGGYVGDMMTVARAHVNDAKAKGEITQAQAGEIYTAMIPSAFQNGLTFELQDLLTELKVQSEELSLKIGAVEELNKAAQVENLIKQGLLYDEELVRKKLDTTKAAGEWVIQEQTMIAQKDMTLVDRDNKQQMVNRDLATKDAQLDSMQADISFNESKKDIMIQTRKDNVRMKATEQFAEFLKYISAANVVPASEDFQNIRDLVTAINDGILDEDAVATLSTTAAGDTQTP